MEFARPDVSDARASKRRIYKVLSPMAGNPLEFEICRCTDALSAVSVLAAILEADSGAVSRVTIEVQNG